MVKRVNSHSMLTTLVMMSISSVMFTLGETICQAAPAHKKAVYPGKSLPGSRKGAKAMKPKASQNGSSTHLGWSPAFNAYLCRLRPKITNNWLLADGKNHVEIKATLHPDGSISNIEVKSVPNNVLAEQSANEAFAKAEPFEPLPAQISTNLTLTIVFDSLADPHGDSTSSIGLRLNPIGNINSKAEKEKPAK